MAKNRKLQNTKITIKFSGKASDSNRILVAQNIATQLENQGIHINIVQLSDEQYYNCLNTKKL